MSFGEEVKALRLKRDISLREFCRRLALDASNWSKVERGLLPPTQDEEKLKKIAEVLEIDSEKLTELKDLASIDSGIIPKDILSDKEVFDALPMFFRTIRSEKPTKEELMLLVDSLRKGG